MFYGSLIAEDSVAKTVQTQVVVQNKQMADAASGPFQQEFHAQLLNYGVVVAVAPAIHAVTAVRSQSVELAEITHQKQLRYVPDGHIQCVLEALGLVTNRILATQVWVVAHLQTDVI
jgi:hypothetical protein